MDKTLLKHLERTVDGALKKWNVWHIPGDARPAFFFRAGLETDFDGASNAYHPGPGRGTDHLHNAHTLTLDEKNGVLVEIDMNPYRTVKAYLQKEGDPHPGYLIAQTALSDHSKPDTDPAKFVDASIIPTISLPKPVLGYAGDKIPEGAFQGDFCAVVKVSTRQVACAIVAEAGPPLGEGSPALGEALGRRYKIKDGTTERRIYFDPDKSDDFVYVVFTRTHRTPPWPVSVDDIRAEGERLFNEWGGVARLEQLGMFG